MHEAIMGPRSSGIEKDSKPGRNIPFRTPPASSWESTLGAFAALQKFIQQAKVLRRHVTEVFAAECHHMQLGLCHSVGKIPRLFSHQFHREMVENAWKIHCLLAP